MVMILMKNRALSLIPQILSLLLFGKYEQSFSIKSLFQDITRPIVSHRGIKYIGYTQDVILNSLSNTAWLQLHV